MFQKRFLFKRYIWFDFCCILFLPFPHTCIYLRKLKAKFNLSSFYFKFWLDTWQRKHVIFNKDGRTLSSSEFLRSVMVSVGRIDHIQRIKKSSTSVIYLGISQASQGLTSKPQLRAGCYNNRQISGECI